MFMWRRGMRGMLIEERIAVTVKCADERQAMDLEKRAFPWYVCAMSPRQRVVRRATHWITMIHSEFNKAHWRFVHCIFLISPGQTEVNLDRISNMLKWRVAVYYTEKKQTPIWLSLLVQASKRHVNHREQDICFEFLFEFGICPGRITGQEYGIISDDYNYAHPLAAGQGLD